ncbi:MAG: Deoxyadenosine/deoxycytidine kinase [Nitrosospira multiformis]|jgi:deoxyadenosine/deoxycytidine kinase|nr:Deoxyadenosine/deoxycytidine kinase [Nitrosospira multiformis]
MSKGISHKRVEICGGIASGKTTLAHLVAEWTGGNLALENFHTNPFWALFYENPDLFMSEKNICFLPQHTGAIKSQGGAELLICDYAVFQDLAYATLCTAEGHLDVMRNIFAHLYNTLPPPTLIIHLLCNSTVQLERIRARGRKEEKSITQEYLDSLNKAIPDFLREMLTTHTQVYEIHSDQVDFAHNSNSHEAIRKRILLSLN